ncbi:MAG: helix-hairpin-helix domain-containing protein [Lachnospiraceae bacterium]|nr:helix-hairpin-helix domain-containing protein [Lachnospiraceae bacterium]
MRKLKTLIFVAAMGFILMACNKSETVVTTFSENEEKVETKQEEKTSNIYVQIDGAVKKPGIYEVAKGSRVFQVVELAGGLKKNASTSSVNQAARVKDEQQIYIATVGEEKAALEQSTKEESGKVNINLADREALMTIPGIGESKADAIINYREENGSFHSIEDLMKISGIKEGVFSKMKDLITV